MPSLRAPGPETATEGAHEEPSEAGQPLLQRFLASDLFVLALTVVLFAAVIPLAPSILAPTNLQNILSNYWPLLLVVIGQTFVLITAGIDLSQTSTMALTNVIGAMLVTTVGRSGALDQSALWGVLFGDDGGVLGHGPAAVIAAWAVMLVLGGLIGAFNGFCVAKVGMPPFMVTLTTMLFASAVAVWSTKSENVRGLPETYQALSNGVVGAVVALAAAVIAHVILARSLFGRWLYAIGINQRTARVSGVPVAGVTVAAYALSGIFCAAGAAFYAARLDAGRPTLASGLLMDVIGAAVIGGVSLFGGRGRIAGAALGVLFFVVLTNALNLMGLEFYTIMWIKGLVILFAVAIDTWRTRRAEASA